MNELNTPICRRVSSVMDGDRDAEDWAIAMDAVLSDPEATRTWHAYQTVGDVLRSSELCPRGDDLLFLSKLQKRLNQEPLTSDRPVHHQLEIGLQSSVQSIERVRSAANSSVLVWKTLAGVSCAALLVVVTQPLWPQPEQASEVAASMASTMVQPEAGGVVTMATAQGPMLRDPRLVELVAAHRQLGGHSALQVPAGFLRSATQDGSTR